MRRRGQRTHSSRSIPMASSSKRLTVATGTINDLAQRVSGDDVALWRAIVSLRERGLIVAKGTDFLEDPNDAPAEEERILDRTIDEIVALGQEGPGGRAV